MAKKKLKAKKTIKPSGKNIVVYVDNSIQKVKVFKDLKKALSFVETYTKENPDPMDGYWIDLLVTNINGKVVAMDQMEIEKG